MPGIPAYARFYHDPPVSESFNVISEEENFVPVPRGWSIIISDVVDSTGAIDRGLYKEVNILGASTLIAVLNITSELEIPFVFGGDGATLLVPDLLMSRVMPVLQSTQNMATEAFNLQLRIGIVPVEKVIEAGLEVKVVKIRLSNRFNLAGFTGGGIGYAEQLIKDPSEGEPYQLERDPHSIKANYSGLECRWNPIRSMHGEIISLLVVANMNKLQSSGRIYGEVLTVLNEIYGMEGDDHPIKKESLRLNLSTSNLMSEFLVKNYRARSLLRAIKFFLMRLETKVGGWFMDRKFKTPCNKWTRYKGDLVNNCDYKKFDDMIRMVISSDSQQIERLENYLQSRFLKGELAYGLHRADEALMTCLIFERHGGHLHFIDGANGGYAQASVGLKERLSALAG